MAQSLEAGKLIVGAVAVYIDPTGTAAMTLGIDSILQVKSWFSKKSDLATLSRELEKAFKAELKKPRYEKPDEAKQLLPQMLEAIALEKDGIAKCDLNADLIFAEMKKAVQTKSPDYRDHALLSAFEDLVLPLLKTACDDPRLVDALKAPLTREQMGLQRETNAKLDQLLAQNKGLMGLLEKLADGHEIATDDILTLDELRELGRMFQVPDSDSKDIILDNLRYQAQQITEMEQQIAELRGENPELDNILAAIVDALDKGRIQEARALFPDVRSLQKRAQLLQLLSEDAKVSELEARAALLEEDVETAFQIYADTADTFKRTDAIASAHRRNTYFEQLYNHGLRYGGPGLALASDMIRPAIAALAGTAHQEDWASYTQNLAGALQTQGNRTAGATGTALLAEAVTAYRDALTVRTRDAQPVQWANTNQNLAVALETMGERTAGAAGTALLAEAVTAYHDVLTVFTRDTQPMQWASTTQNLAGALQLQGSRTEGEAGTALLAQAVAAYREALTVLTRDAHPVQWAMTTQNLAVALQTQGSRTAGAAGTALLAQAVAAYRETLTVSTHEAHPVQWATTQVNLALAERALARHPATADPDPHWDAALRYVDAALTVYDPVNMAYDHDTATDLRDDILARR